MQLDDFWKSDVCEISEFSNLPLEPLGDAAGEVLLAGSRSRAVARSRGRSDGFDQPERLSPWIVDRGAARHRISAATGRPWRQTVQPSLSTSGETLTIEESMNLEGENGDCWDVGDEHEWSQGSG